LLFGGRLLRPASLAAMVEFRPYEGGEWDGYGLGVEHQTLDGQTIWGHDGDGRGMHVELWYLPRLRVCIATMWNDDAIETPDLPSALLRTLLGRT
jgi:hypothetical protein